MHFNLYVICDKNPENVADVGLLLEDVMAPFSEHLEVDPYVTDCYCQYSKLRGKYELLYETYLTNMMARAKITPDVKTHHEILDYAKQKCMKFEGIYQPPKQPCPDCENTGVFMSKYNPNSQWDWWEIGGRWNECLYDLDRQNIPTAIKCGKNINIRKISEISEFIKRGFLKPAACLTPEWEWIERPSEHDILHYENDGYIISVDCHI